MQTNVVLVAVATLAAACGIVEATAGLDADGLDAAGMAADASQTDGPPGDQEPARPLDAAEFVNQACYCVTTGQTTLAYCTRGTCANPATSCEAQRGGAGRPTTCMPGC